MEIEDARASVVDHILANEVQVLGLRKDRIDR